MCPYHKDRNFTFSFWCRKEGGLFRKGIVSLPYLEAFACECVSALSILGLVDLLGFRNLDLVRRGRLLEIGGMIDFRGSWFSFIFINCARLA